MSRRVFLHIGLPKTGTTFLQQILWASKDKLRESGLLLPGAGHRVHLWAALDVREHRNLEKRNPRAPGTWARLVDQIRDYPGDALITHEFFCTATSEQAERAIAQLQGREVHLIVTARHTLDVLISGLQERVKNGGQKKIESVSWDPGPGGAAEFTWRAWDLDGVLKRWAPHVAPQHVHILPVPPRHLPSDTHWSNFAAVLGVDAALGEIPEGRVNSSLGVAQVELMWRINQRLEGTWLAKDRGRYLRGYLAESKLATQAGQRMTLGNDLVEECRARAAAAVQRIRDNGHAVTGDVESLLVPEEASPGRSPDEVSDAELLDASLDLVAKMMADIRDSEAEL